MIHYSPRAYYAAIGLWVASALVLIAYGLVREGGGPLVLGLVVLLLGIVFMIAVSGRIRSDGPALEREGEFLVGAELSEPLPVSETTFEIVPDHNGSWVVILHCRGSSITLAPGGWKVAHERFFTKAVAERSLLALGLAKHRRT